MAENEIINEEPIKVDEQLGEGIWGITKPAVVVTEIKEIIEPVKVVEPIILDIPTDWLKKEFNIDDPAILKAEREELKKLKETPLITPEIQFTDDTSRQIYEILQEGGEKKKELRKVLELHEQIDELSSINIVDKDNAASIIKLEMRLQNKNLSDSEIDFEYKQNFTAPKEPVQKATEEEEDFKERYDDWKEQVANIEMRRLIAAKKAQPELAKLKSEIVLPSITPKEITPANKPLTQEELEVAKKLQTDFIDGVNSELKNFNEISVLLKDEAVEIPIPYTFSVEEKTKISDQLKYLAENGFNSNFIFGGRWVNDDKTFNVSRMIRDLAYLNNEEKISQKLVTDSASKRLHEYTKQKKNIQLDTITSKVENGQLDIAKALEEVEAAIWINR